MPIARGRSGQLAPAPPLVDAIKAHAPPIVDTREGDVRLLNWPKVDGDVGHASQNDIDALFD